MADQVGGDPVPGTTENPTDSQPYEGVVEDEDLLDEENAPPIAEYKIIMDPNFYYPADHIENPLDDSPISRRMAQFQYALADIVILSV